jgi:hypothetical protein
MALTAAQLSDMLSKMYRGAPHGEATTTVHLFGIRHAEDIRASGASAAAVVKASDVPDSYITEVHKGIALARHVAERHAERSAGWVTTRARSTPDGVFSELRAQVRSDVEEFNSLQTGEHPHSRFLFEEDKGIHDRFSVSRSWQYVQSWVAFHLFDQATIEIHGRDGRGEFKLVVTIEWAEDDSYSLRVVSIKPSKAIPDSARSVSGTTPGNSRYPCSSNCHFSSGVNRATLICSAISSSSYLWLHNAVALQPRSSFHTSETM